MIKTWFEALKIKHWIKNFFVFVPFLASRKFGVNESLLLASAGVVIFGLMSSAVYLFNDCADIEADRQHPTKRSRPVASGRIPVRVALTVAFVLAAVAMAAALELDLRFSVVLAVYAANNILYSYYLKHKTVLDVMTISLGFVLRAYGGGFLIGIDITKWLVACVFSLSLLFGFGKRRTEYEDLKEDSGKARKVQESYTVQKLNLLLGISASVTIVTYMLYTISPETRALHGTDNLIFTTPLVIYGVYRYLLKVQEEKQGGPVEIILKDKAFILAGVLWLITYLAVVHL